MKLTIAILPGDGIGPEVMAEALKVLEAVGEKFGHEFSFQHGLVGGAAYEKFESHFPEETKKICENSDAILFGSVGGPVGQQHLQKWQNCERHSILAIRKTFQFFANLRPAKIYPELIDICPLKNPGEIDILIIRELIGDIYFGEHSKSVKEGKRMARDVMEYDEGQIAAIAHMAFKAAQSKRKKVTSIDKSNVLDCSKLWREVVVEVSRQYPNIQLEHMLVDNCALQLIKNPSQFDVLLCPNMFGDILSDEAAALPGSLGLMPSASLNAHGFGLYEPAGGSAPDIAGKGISNPIAQILSAAMMLRYSFHLEKEAQAIEQAVEKTLKAGTRTRDLSEKNAASTVEMTEAIISHL